MNTLQWMARSGARAVRAAVAAGVATVAGVRPAAAQAGPDLEAELRVVRRVLAAPELKRALAYVDGSDEETIREWLSICNAYGPTGDEGHRSRLLYKLFRMYGLERVRIDDARNVIGVRKGTGGGPAVVLNAHHDNVALWPAGQPVEAFVADGRVWCPAARDDLLGVVQMLTVLRALNAAEIRTGGDIWFVGFTGEEPLGNEASPGVEHFVRANVPHNLDWRRGDILMQFHGGGGEGVTTGSTPLRHRTILTVFSPFDRDRWKPHAVDALGRIIARVGAELRDEESGRVSLHETGRGELTGDLLYLNMSAIGALPIVNAPGHEAYVRFDLRASTEARLWRAHRDIQRIAAEVTAGMGEGFDFVYEIVNKNGTETGIEGWDPVANAPARVAAAAAAALYGTRPVIDPTRGCGDCVRAYAAGMPAMSLRGDVIDFGERGRFEVRRGRERLDSAVRRRSAGHDVTESAPIEELWSGVKHGLLFAVAYAGLAEAGRRASDER